MDYEHVHLLLISLSHASVIPPLAEAPPARRALPRPAVVVAAPRRSDWRRPLPGLGIPEAQDFWMMMVDG